MMYHGLIGASAVALVAVSLMHSIAGEILLLRPMMKKRGNAVLDDALARFVLRAAWHVTSAAWLVLAVILTAMIVAPQMLAQVVLHAIGWSFLMVGLGDMILSRGRHIGWPLLSLVGGFALAAAYIAA